MLICIDECMSWTMWAASSLAPIIGQANHYTFLATIRLTYSQERYRDELNRMILVLDNRLSTQRHFLVGEGRGQYSIADIASFCMLVHVQYFDISLEPFHAVRTWIKRINRRKAVEEAMRFPPNALSADALGAFLTKLKTKVSELPLEDSWSIWSRVTKFDCEDGCRRPYLTLLCLQSEEKASWTPVLESPSARHNLNNQD